MDYPWELVLDHSYKGVPGVIFDQSPGRAGHGTPRGIADADFLVDGSAPRSGAVRMRGGNRAVAVDLGPQWRVVGGVAVDIVCSADAIETPGTLIESDCFNLALRAPRIFEGFVQTQGGSVGFGGDGPVDGEFGDWITVSLFFDGWQFLNVSIDGQLALSFPDRGGYRPLIGGRRIAIGNRLNGTDGLRGVIDDVKIWRLNPRAVDENVGRRPMFGPVSHCWANWGTQLVSALKGDRECPSELRFLIENAIQALRRAVPTDEAFDRWESGASKYAAAWRTNKLDKIPPIATAMLQWLREQGVEPMDLPEVQALLQSPCFKKVVDHTISPLACDPAFRNMIVGIAQGY